MSRVIVKNLPKYYTEEKVKKFFEQKFAISDVKLLTTPDGRTRRFAYVGFVHEADATAAIKTFNNSFIDTSKICVEIAKSKNDQSLPRPWSKYSTGSSAYAEATGTLTEAQKALREKKETEKSEKLAAFEAKKRQLMAIYADEDPAADADLKQYMDVMRPTSKVKTWENEGLSEIVDSAAKNVKQKRAPKVKVNLDAVVDKTSSGRGNLVSRTRVVFDDDCSSDDSEEEEVTEVQTKDQSVASALSDKEDEEQTENNITASSIEPNGAQEAEVSLDAIGETGRLYVRNLPYECSEDELKELFARYGPITSLHMPISFQTKRPKGFAFVLFVFPEHAVKAFAELDGSIFKGRIIHLLPAAEAPSSDAAEAHIDDASFNDKKTQKIKATAGSAFNWNSLFLNPNAISDAIAKELGIPKSSLLDATSESVAIQMSLAETKIINDTKAYLEQEGVVLDAFSSCGGKKSRENRSDTVLLIKNIPFETTVSELDNLFNRYGSVIRLVLPPSKCIALVEFCTPQEARNAFKNLAYSKFKHVPLYLEWAPVAVLAAKPASKKQAKDDDSVAAATEQLSNAAVGVSLYVKNLNFSTTEDALRRFFEPVGGLLAAKIATKPDPKNSASRLSMGFGFVEFRDKSSAIKALDSMQNAILEGHALKLKIARSNSTTDADDWSNSKTSVTVSKAATNKLMIRNIPFEASTKEVKTLFNSFGSVKKVRLPRKFDGNHRGFGFIEFVTKTDAAKALQTLTHTHLYGRHLVIEWANEEDLSVEGLRAKTRRLAEAMENIEANSASAPKKLQLGGDDDNDEADNSLGSSDSEDGNEEQEPAF